ncbi:MAG: Flp family type IVb pilin [Chloroflexota bacterium]
MALVGRAREIRDRAEGQAVVEYAVLLALILIAAVATIGLVGGGVTSMFTTVKNDL